MQSPQITASSDEKGVAHAAQAGPTYRLMPDQQFLQKGAEEMLSEGESHEGQVEGKSWSRSFAIKPERQGDVCISRI
jgi:hypothetical protein